MNEHEDARWRIFREMTVINGVESREVGRAGHAIDTLAFDNLRQRRAGSLQTMLELLQDQLALPFKCLGLISPLSGSKGGEPER